MNFSMMRRHQMTKAAHLARQKAKTKPRTRRYTHFPCEFSMGKFLRFDSIKKSLEINIYICVDLFSSIYSSNSELNFEFRSIVRFAFIKKKCLRLILFILWKILHAKWETQNIQEATILFRNWPDRAHLPPRQIRQQWK